VIDRILREILDEQATANLDDRGSLKAHFENRLGGQWVVVIPPEKDVVTARREETFVETDCIVDLEGSR